MHNLTAFWTKSPDGPDGGKSLTKKRSRTKRIDLEPKQDLEDGVKALKTGEKKELQLCIESLVKTRDGYTQEVSDLDKSLKEIKEKLSSSQDLGGVQRILFTQMQIQ